MRTRDIDIGNRTVHGIVNGDGSIYSGVGFTVQKLGAGTYQIRLSSPLKVLRSVTAALAQNQPWLIQTGGVQPSGMTVSTYNYSAVSSDTAFSFSMTGF